MFKPFKPIQIIVFFFKKMRLVITCKSESDLIRITVCLAVLFLEIQLSSSKYYTMQKSVYVYFQQLNKEIFKTCLFFPFFEKFTLHNKFQILVLILKKINIFSLPIQSLVERLQLNAEDITIQPVHPSIIGQDTWFQITYTSSGTTRYFSCQSSKGKYV